MPKEEVYQDIHDELLLDGDPKLNMASFVTTAMEEECNKLIIESINKNAVNIDQYPVTNDFHIFFW
ncbi:Glutamate decarboxylase 3, partial [Mucuna pruriens]